MAKECIPGLSGHRVCLLCHTAGAGRGSTTDCETLGNGPAANEGVNSWEVKRFSIEYDHVARKQAPSLGIP